MKIGLLLCDHVNPLLAPNFDDYPIMFTKLFREYVPEVELVVYD